MSVRSIEEIKQLRFGEELSLDLRNTNRYAVVANERGAFHTAYFFNAPIYNRSSRKIVNGGFNFTEDGGYVYKGSDSIVRVVSSLPEAVKNKNNTDCKNEVFCKTPYRGLLIRLEQADSSSFGMTLSFKNEKLHLENGDLLSESLNVSPSLNGIRVKASNRKGGVTFILHIDEPFISTRNNTKCFVLMESQFRPYALVSVLGNAEYNGKISAPAVMISEQIDDTTYRINISSPESTRGELVFEVSLYEEKLFQDTTVESMNPLENNAFGISGFIGESKLFGTQWLYSRIDISKLSMLLGRRILEAKLYIPILSSTKLTLCAYRIAKRFCSFGSSWDGKVPVTNKAAEASVFKDYYVFDLTEIITDENHRLFQALDGIVIRAEEKESGFTAIATGDCSMPSQILVIRYR